MTHGEQAEEQPEDELERADPVGGRAALVGVQAAREREHDRADHHEAHDPAEHERGTVDAPARRDEHQDDGDDRERAERHGDRGRQHLADGFAHPRN